MIPRLSQFAEQQGLIAVAPDSTNVAGVWVVGQRSREVRRTIAT